MDYHYKSFIITFLVINEDQNHRQRQTIFRLVMIRLFKWDHRQPSNSQQGSQDTKNRRDRMLRLQKYIPVQHQWMVGYRPMKSKPEQYVCDFNRILI